MPRDFFPRREADILGFTGNFKDKIVASASSFGLTPLQAAQYSATQAQFAAAYRAIIMPGTRTSPAVQAKNTALKALEAETRMLAKLIRAFPDVTGTMRSELGLSVKAARRKRVAPPHTAPYLIIDSVRGRSVRLHLIDAVSNRTRRPRDVIGATLLCYVGTEPAANPLQWSLVRNTSRARLTVRLNADVPLGSGLWLAAYWFNTRKQPGPPSTPVFVPLSHGMPAVSGSSALPAQPSASLSSVLKQAA